MKIKLYFYSLCFIANIKLIYPQAGQLDTTFGPGGIVNNTINPIRQNSFTRSIVIQDDEKILVAGSISGDFMLMRYSQDGKFDDSFGLNGIASTR